MSGMSRSGRVFKTAALGKIRGQRWVLLAPVLADRLQQPRQAFQREAVEVRLSGRVAENEVDVVLQILPDAGRRWQCLDAVPAEAALSPTPDSINNCGVWNAPEARITSATALRICFNSLPCRYSTPTSSPASNRMRVAAPVSTRRTRGQADMRVEVVSAALQRHVLLRDLVDAEPSCSPALKSSRRRNCALLAACKGLPHRIVGAQFVDRERTAFAVILAVEIGTSSARLK